MTPTTLITRQTIDETPGADRTTGTEMITDYVPGSYVVHDMLHMRGGHQTSWLIDGVAIPNTKIASNVGPQIDPKDIDSLETERGSYDADLGDRTYGMFDVLPRNGFEFNRNGEVMLYGGNFDQRRGAGCAGRPLGEERMVCKRDRLALELWSGDAGGGDRSRCDELRERVRFADPEPAPKDQFARGWAVPAGFFSGTVRSEPERLRVPGSDGLLLFLGPARHAAERDSFVVANWVHTISPKALVSVAPFYHFNQADYDSLATTSRWRRRGISNQTTRAHRQTRARCGPQWF